MAAIVPAGASCYGADCSAEAITWRDTTAQLLQAVVLHAKSAGAPDGSDWPPAQPGGAMGHPVLPRW